MSPSSSRSDGHHSFPVVGIGASAGGLEAVQAFLEALPADLKMAFVLVMHLSPDRESHLGEVLASSTEMPVTTVSERADLEAGHLYVIQPETDLELQEGARLVAESRSEREVPAHPIDRLFRSLAREVGERAVAVVLSGSGSDGAQGVREVNRENGLVLVQDPEEASFRSMPEAAIDAIRPDLVLTAGDLGKRLAGLIERGPKRRLVPDRTSELESEEQAAFGKLLTRINEQAGHDFTCYKSPTILRRMNRRMQVRGADTLSAYLDLTRDRPEELEILCEDLLIPVTSFFRDREVFGYLSREVIPHLFDARTAEETVRVWIPACSTGEEAYTYAILLAEQARSRSDVPDLQLFGTDLSKKAIERARAGRYPVTIAEDIEKPLLDRYFSKEEEEYVVQPRIRDRIVFAEHDVLADPPFTQIDLVSCRNLLIYLNAEAQQRVLEIAHFALRSPGWLVLGTAESAEAQSDLFRPERQDLGLYRRAEVQSPPANWGGWVGAGRQGERIRTAFENRPDTTLDPGVLHREFRAALLSRPSVLVDGEYRVLHLSAGADRFLQLSGGQRPETIFDLSTGRLQTALRTALYTAAREGSEIVRRAVPWGTGREEGDEENRRVTIRIRPERTDEDALYLIVFEQERPASNAGLLEEPDPERQQTDRTVEQLEEALRQTRQELRATTEQYESVNEELRASNEELISMNEELQSTTEELETRKEELESMNEEMQTVNEELSEKVEALHEAYADLENLMAATQIPTLFLNQALEIRRFTPTTTEIFNVRPSDEGRPISDLTTDLEYETLEDDARRACREETVIERELRCAEERWFLGRVRPYYTANDEIDGAVLSFIDVTDQKRAEQQLERLNEQLEERVRERTRELEEEITERKRLQREVLRMADEDRYLLAESLHDGIGQELTGIRMMSRSLLNSLEAMELTEQADKARQIEEAIAEADDHARQLAREIVPVELAEGGGLVDALERFTSDMVELHGVAVELEVGDLEAISEELATQLFRIVQEAGLNAALHGDCENLVVRTSLEGEGRQVRLEVADDGTGLSGQIDELKQEGMGLRIMQYRVQVLGGEFELEPREEGGTRLICELPLDPDADS